MATIINRYANEVVVIAPNIDGEVQVQIDFGSAQYLMDSVAHTFDEEFATMPNIHIVTFALDAGENVYIKCVGTVVLVINKGLLV